jgi:hypothetical protein
MTFSHMQAGSGPAKNSAIGFFFMMAQDLGDSQYQDLFKAYSNVPIDSCTMLPVVMNGANGMSSSLDAGMVSILGPDGTSYPIAEKKPLGLVTYTASLPDTAFTPDAHYQLVALGGAVGAFMGDFYTPGDLTVTGPQANGPLSASIGGAIDLTWTGASDGTDILVSITQLATTINCRLTDDGSFTIPASTTANFMSTMSGDRPVGADMYDAIYVTRTNWYSIGSSDSATLVISQVGAKYDVDFE